MALFVSYFLVALAILLAIPVAMFVLEIVAALTLPRRENCAQFEKFNSATRCRTCTSAQ